ncbi:hypothetical protein SLE2022_012500 [Rubroshorea leprosula]
MAAEMVAELLLGPVVDFTISKVFEQLDSAVGFEQERRRFRSTLEMVSGFLLDAEQKCVADSSGVKPWLEGLRSIAEEADDVMDEISYENLRRKVAAKKQMLKQVSYFFTASNPIAFRLKMANKIKNLNAELDALNTRATVLRLQGQQRLERSLETRGIQQTDSLLGDPSGVIGRDGDVQKIVKLLIDSSTQQPLCVFSIVGIAGLGKTTLAKQVCNNDQIRGHFSSIMWICVSDNFDVMGILVQMLESLSEGHRENITNRDAIVQKIKGKLEQTTYLLILDDVWNEKRREWTDLRDCLLGLSKKNGNRVLVTTRIQQVAKVMGVLPEHQHCLKQLEDDDCWSVIRHRVFGNSPIPSELETIGRENAKKCGGVPLVASVIGGMLCATRDEYDWREVWGLIEEGDEVFPVLKLSFSRLPKPALKQCFAFCSIFPKDFVMEKEMLIQLWMAHGFLSCERQMEMEATGDKYFNDLLSYSLFQDAEKDSCGRVIACKMHDLIHDLAQSVSEPQTLILGNGSGSNITADIRHLNLISDEGMAGVEIGDALEKLHTLFSKTDVFHDMPANLKKVRALSFCGANIDKLPAVLRKLKHLRYLDVSKTKIKELPEFISKLYQLQTLRFMYCDCIERPLEGIGNLVNLRHLYFSSEKLMSAGSLSTCTSLKSLSIGPCDSLESVPSLDGLSSLQSISIKHCRLKSIGGSLSTCTSLKSLSIEFCYSLESISSLDGLSSLQSISIKHCRLKSIGGSLSTCTSLKSLSIKFCYSLESIPSLDGLSSLQSISIKHCSLKSIGGSLSTCTSLKSLFIESCYSLESIPSLDGLSSLQSIYIKQCRLKSIGGSLSTCTSLKSLSIESCYSLESIPSLDGLSSLQSIYIKHCGLKSIGGSLSTCTSLKILFIESCDSLESIPSLDGLSSLQSICIWNCGLKSIGESLSTCTSLKILSIESCDSLESIPSLDGLSSLQSIKIAFCGLKSIGESLSTCTSLESLSIEHCDSLELVPSLHGLSSLQSICITHCGLKSIGGSLSTCTSLKILSIESCDSLESIPSLDGLSSLQSIKIAFCGLKSIGESLSTCTSLESLSIEHCDSLELVPSLHGLSSLQSICITHCGLKSIGGSLSTCTSLESLSIEYCDCLESVPSLDGLSSLQSICITHCGLKSIGGSLSTCTSLKIFSIEYCDSLESIPSLDGLSSVEELTTSGVYNVLVSRPKSLTIKIWGCGQLKSIGESLSNSVSLKNLSIDYCNSLESVPSLDGLSSLETLSIEDCAGLTSLPNGLSSCTALETLKISDCGNLISISEDLRDLRFLVELEITCCGKLRNIRGLGEILGCLTRLRKLHFGGFSAEEEDIEEYPTQLEELTLIGWEKLENLPCQIQHLTALRKLRLEDFDGIEALPDWLGNLSSLQSLYIFNCKSLRYMKAIRRLSNLKTLNIEACPELGGRCAKESGSEWSNISHIPDISIDGKNISDNIDDDDA